MIRLALAMVLVGLYAATASAQQQHEHLPPEAPAPLREGVLPEPRAGAVMLDASGAVSAKSYNTAQARDGLAAQQRPRGARGLCG